MPMPLFLVLQADIIVCNYETRQRVHKFTLHKVMVRALAFSASDKYLVSLGGDDDNRFNTFLVYFTNFS